VAYDGGKSVVNEVERTKIFNTNVDIMHCLCDKISHKVTTKLKIQETPLLNSVCSCREKIAQKLLKAKTSRHQCLGN